MTRAWGHASGGSPGAGRATRGLALTLLLMADSACAEVPRIELERPGDREFVVDLADLLEADEEAAVRKTCDRLLTDRAIPIVVVTLESMADHGGGSLRIETFAHLLFDQWGVGPAQVDGTPWNKGILLLVSRKDRLARIQLGSGWSRNKDVDCQDIMDRLVVPAFRTGAYGRGLVEGVEALERMARGERVTWGKRVPGASPAGSMLRDLVVSLMMVALALFTVVSFSRHGTDGWAFHFWKAVLIVLGGLLLVLLAAAAAGGRSGGGSSSRGGGFSGGSFGGGFSGGGGATGSW